MRAEHAAEQVMRAADVGDPVAHGFVDGVLQGARAGLHAAHFRAQQPHAKDVEFLAAHVFRAHVHDAIESEQRADGGGGDAVLAGAGFGDDAALAHALGKQRLADAVVDFVRAGVEQVFALQVNARAAEFFGQATGKEERRGPSGVLLEQVSEVALKFLVAAGAAVGGFQFLECGDEGFRNVASAVVAEASGVGIARLADVDMLAGV